MYQLPPEKTNESRHVLTLSYVVVISKRHHQLVADSCVLLEAESFLFHTLAPPVVWKARRDHVERNAIRTLLQRGKQFRNFDIGSRPAVDEQERDGIWRLGLLVHVVDVKVMKAISFNAFTKIGEFVELGLLSPPVESVLPVLGQALDVCEWRTVVPSSFIELWWCQQANHQDVREIDKPHLEIGPKKVSALK